MASGIPTVTLDEDVPVPMRDGTVLRADVWRPVGQADLPVVLLRTPYGKTRADSICHLHPSWLARRGYIVAVQDCRGRYASEGDFTPFFAEADDTEDTILWAGELPGGNGRVGMYGFSYAGAVQLQGAVRRPEPLRAICPAMTSADFYEGWTYVHGALSLAFTASWATALGEDAARRRGEGPLADEYLLRSAAPEELYWRLPLTGLRGLGAEDPAGFFADWVAHQTYDDYWRAIDVSDGLAGIDAATMVVGGLFDSFLEGNVNLFESMKGGAAPASSFLLGPWHHMPWTAAFGDSDFGTQAGNRVNEAQVAFLDQWLRDGDPAEDGVRAFLTGRNTWERFETWPPPSDPWTLHLGASSRANSVYGDGRLTEEEPGAEPPDVFSYDPADPVPSRGGHSCCAAELAPMGPADQRPVESLNEVLVYTSDPLPADRCVAGMIEATLYAATSAPDTDWTIKVCDVDPDGRSVNVQESIQRARHHASGAPISPGEVTRFDVEVGTCSHVFRAGQRVRVQVSSSDFPQWDRNLNTGNAIGVDGVGDRIVATQTVLHEAGMASAVTLPLLGE